MRKLISVFAIAFLTSVGMVSLSSPSTATELTEKGKAGVAQLAECLQTSESLEIVYVIDNSGSLLKNLDGSPGTDPKYKRADIIYDDLLRWAEIGRSREKMDITFSAIGFTQVAEKLANRTKLELDEVAAANQARTLRKNVRDRTPQGWTNWEAGISAAAARLSTSTADCKTIVWFTDGGLNVSEHDKSRNMAALEKLCGSPISGSSLPSSAVNGGVVQQLRDNGVHLFGIGLNDPNHPETGGPKRWDANYWRGFMQSIAEGDGSNLAPSKKDKTLPSGSFVCGLNDDVEGSEYAHGAFLEAQSAAEVALAFLNLSAIAQNGTVQDCESDGTFFVDPGIASVQIINKEYGANPDSLWEVKDAEGVVRASSKDKGNPAGSSKRIAVGVSEPEQWQVSGVACSVVAFLEIHPVLDQKTVFSGLPASITGSFVRDSQRGDVGINRFTSNKLSVAVDGQPLNPSDVSFEPNSGAFNIAIAGATAEAINLTFDLELQTEHWNLATLSFDIAKEIVNADKLPTVDEFIPDGTLDSADDTLELSSTVSPPAAGGEGQVCFAESDQIRIVTDNQHEIGASQPRENEWNFDWTGLDGNCVTVSDSTGPVKVALGVSNIIPRNSSVTTVVDYSLKAAGGEFPDSQAVQFESFRQHDWLKFALIFVVIFLGGILIPLLMLYVLNLLTARIIRGNNLMHGVFDVTYSLDDGSIKSANEIPLNSGKIGLESFKFLPPSTNSSNADVPGLGQLSAVVPLMPLTEPWFEIRAMSGTRVFNATSPRRTSPKEFETGQKALFSGDVGNFWAITFAEAALADAAKSGGDVKGKLHVYMRNASPNFTETLVGILAQPRFNQRVLAAAKMQAASTAQKGGSGGPTKRSTSSRPGDPPPPSIKPKLDSPPRPGETHTTAPRSTLTGPANPTGPSIGLPIPSPKPGGATPPPPPPPPAAR